MPGWYFQWAVSGQRPYPFSDHAPRFRPGSATSSYLLEQNKNKIVHFRSVILYLSNAATL